MTIFVALLGSINVGGTGLLPMKELAALCTGIGLKAVRTYIQSGNVIFESPLSEKAVKTKLEQALARKMGKPIGVLIRSASELRATLEANPFPDAKPSQVGVVFMDGPVPADFTERLKIPGREEVRPVGREIFVHFPDGMGQSKLKLPITGARTTRNLNTVAKLIAMTAA